MRTHLAPQAEIRRLQTTHHLVEVDVCFKMASVVSGQEKPILKGSVCFSLVSVAKLWRLKGGWSTKVLLEMTGFDLSSKLVSNRHNAIHESLSLSMLKILKLIVHPRWSVNHAAECCKHVDLSFQWYGDGIGLRLYTYLEPFEILYLGNVIEILPTYILKKRFLLPSKIHCTSTSTKHLVSCLYLPLIAATSVGLA